ncbi:ATPase [Palleniella muris]|uniref:ATPase n=1 Tax=Palleniella muris TaxID=3038145 RepID=A0AC61QMJ6_9BACT|nr:ATPase [Palleniella muris]TGX80651.1 ATPase [Palleniella muris]
MILLADGGSTKVDWVLRDGDNCIERCTTVGLNPIHVAEHDIEKVLANLVCEHPGMLHVDAIEFYGSGCLSSATPKMEGCLRRIFGDGVNIVVGSDIIGAAKAVCGGNEGIACILGTGANSCLWSGREVIAQTPALGYVLGDEGSGAVLGKLFLNALYKNPLLVELRAEFEKEHCMDMLGVIENVYRNPQPNRWLASLSPFISNHLDNSVIEDVVKGNFSSFFAKNILPYNRPDLPVSFVGSIAFYYERQLRSVAEGYDIRIGRILKTPL